MEFESAANNLFARGSRNGYVTALSAAFWLFSVADTHGSTPADRAPVQELSESESTWLKHIGESHPCAAAAVLLLSRVKDDSVDGVFEFEGIPSVHTIEFMLDKADGSAFDKWEPAMLRGPYSTAQFFVQVRWSLKRIDAARSIISTDAQLVDATGRPLQPRHAIEPPVAVLVSPHAYRILSAHEAL